MCGSFFLSSPRCRRRRRRLWSSGWPFVALPRLHQIDPWLNTSRCRGGKQQLHLLTENPPNPPSSVSDVDGNLATVVDATAPPTSIFMCAFAYQLFNLPENGDHHPSPPRHLHPLPPDGRWWLVESAIATAFPRRGGALLVTPGDSTAPLCNYVASTPWRNDDVISVRCNKNCIHSLLCDPADVTAAADTSRLLRRLVSN